VVNVVGPSVHIAKIANPAGARSELVAIGTHFDTAAVRTLMTDALRPTEGPASATALRRWQRHVARA
jgi:hypothetical protein